MAATFSVSCAITELYPNLGLKDILVQSPSCMIASDIITVNLADYGISNSGVLGVIGWVHTSHHCILISDQPTTSVSAGVLTITAPTRVPTAYSRYYRITGNSN